jgi:hypothetical protein
MQIGDLKMPLNLLLLILVWYPLMKLALFVDIFSSWGVALFYGKHIRRLVLVAVHVRPK